MIPLAFALAYVIVGTVIGRVLFRKVIKGNVRYQVGKVRHEYSYDRLDALIRTDAMSSAQTYGLWSIVAWPLCLAIFLIQGPTPEEKQREQDELTQKIIETFRVTA